MKVAQLYPTLRPHWLYSPWNSKGQNTEVGSRFLLQGVFPTQGSHPVLPHCRQILYQLSHWGRPHATVKTLSWKKVKTNKQKNPSELRERNGKCVKTGNNWSQKQGSWGKSQRFWCSNKQKANSSVGGRCCGSNCVSPKSTVEVLNPVLMNVTIWQQAFKEVR